MNSFYIPLWPAHQIGTVSIKILDGAKCPALLKPAQVHSTADGMPEVLPSAGSGTARVLP